MNAKPAATMKPGALHQTGTINPDTVISQPVTNRSKCTTATIALERNVDRSAQTGEVRKISAYSEEEFLQRLSADPFD
jgi:hypothetical protein